MKRLRFLLLFVAAVSAGPSARAVETLGNARPKGGPFGLGVMLGDPSGLSAKWFFLPVHALDFAFGYGFEKSGTAQFHADYLFHPHVLVSEPYVRVPWYLGAGPAVNFWEGKFRMGVRFPFGLEWCLTKIPLDAFFEFAPGAEFVDPGFRWDIAIGARYWF